MELRLRLSPRIRNIAARTALCALLLIAANKPADANSIPTKSDVVWIGVAIAAIGAGIGIGIYAAIHHGHSLNGCAISGEDGLQLQNKGDGQIYSLSGEVAAIKPGEHVRVSGKKAKKSAGAAQQFVVENLSKDYGACKVHPAAP